MTINQNYTKKDLNFIKKGALSSENYHEKVKSYLKKKFKYNNSIVTTSCTAALEIISLALNLKKNDEIIVPAFTFVSTALPFSNLGAKIVFCDINPTNLNMSISDLKTKINKKTKAIIFVHYNGNPEGIDEVIKLKKKNKFVIIEDAAHSFGKIYKNEYVGKKSDFSVFSFHETKNISCLEGGLLVVNNNKFVKKLDIIANKGTNRTSFLNNKTKYYSWKYKGISGIPSNYTCALLYSQLLKFKKILKNRKKLYLLYLKDLLKNLNHKHITFLSKETYLKSNYHLFFIFIKNKNLRKNFIKYSKKKNIECSRHYVPLDKSTYGKKFLKNGQKLIHSTKLGNELVRLPLNNKMTINQIKNVNKLVLKYFQNF